MRLYKPGIFRRSRSTVSQRDRETHDDRCERSFIGIAYYRRNAKSRNKLQYVRGERVSRCRSAPRSSAVTGSGSAHSGSLTRHSALALTSASAAGVSGCGGVPARPSIPAARITAQHGGSMGGRIAGAVSSSCCRLRSHPALRTGERPRDQRAMRWHDALLAPEATVEQHRDRTEITDADRCSTRACTRAVARRSLCIEAVAIDSVCVMDTPS